MNRVKPIPSSTIVESLAARARATPHGLAYVVDDTETITYDRLWEKVRQTAAVLASQGLKRRQCCALALPTGLDFIRLLYAIQLLGAIPVALNPSLPPTLILRRLQRIDCHLLMVQHAMLADLESSVSRDMDDLHIMPVEHLPQMQTGSTPPLINIEPDEIAYLQFTSGTTGEPRAAMISHRSLMASLHAALIR